MDISDYIIQVVALCCLHENSQATFVYVKSPYLPCIGVHHYVKSNSIPDLEARSTSVANCVNKIRSGKTKLFWTCEHYLLASVKYMPSQMLAYSGDERMKNFL
jgi:hypothetical protein